MNALMAGLVTIINALNDPLRSDGDTLATALKAVGNNVEQKSYMGVTHEFFGMAKVVADAKNASMLAVKKLKAEFAKKPMKPMKR